MAAAASSNPLALRAAASAHHPHHHLLQGPPLSHAILRPAPGPIRTSHGPILFSPYWLRPHPPLANHSQSGASPPKAHCEDEKIVKHHSNDKNRPINNNVNHQTKQNGAHPRRRCDWRSNPLSLTLNRLLHLQLFRSSDLFVGGWMNECRDCWNRAISYAECIWCPCSSLYLYSYCEVAAVTW